MRNESKSGRNRKLLATAIVLSLSSACCSSPTSVAPFTMDTTINLIQWRYHPSRLIATVNALRRMGKERAIQILTIYASDPADLPRNADVILICRCLFVSPPDGWPKPSLGGPHPTTEFDGERAFPLFPLVISDDIPFLLVQGYSLGGIGTTGIWQLRRCQNLPIRSHDMPEFDPVRAEKAATKLIESAEFQALYASEKDKINAIDFVRYQSSPLISTLENGGTGHVKATGPD